MIHPCSPLFVAVIGFFVKLAVIVGGLWAGYYFLVCEHVVIFADTREEWYIVLQASFRSNVTVETRYPSFGEGALCPSCNETKVRTVIGDYNEQKKIVNVSGQPLKSNSSSITGLELLDGGKFMDAKSEEEACDLEVSDDTQESAQAINSLCNDPKSKSPVLFSFLLQKSRLLSSQTALLGLQSLPLFTKSLYLGSYSSELFGYCKGDNMSHMLGNDGQELVYPDIQFWRQVSIKKFLRMKKTDGVSFNSEVRNRKEYRNPDFLVHTVTYQAIDQIGSCFPKDVFDPHGYLL